MRRVERAERGEDNEALAHTTEVARKLAAVRSQQPFPERRSRPEFRAPPSPPFSETTAEAVTEGCGLLCVFETECLTAPTREPTRIRRSDMARACTA